MNGDAKSNPGQLSKCLREWTVNAPLPPRFQEGVWRSIEHGVSHGTADLWTMLQEFADRLLARRAWAAAYLVLALAVGLSFGLRQARAENTAQKEILGRQYVQSIDPYLKTRH